MSSAIRLRGPPAFLLATRFGDSSTLGLVGGSALAGALHGAVTGFALERVLRTDRAQPGPAATA